MYPDDSTPAFMLWPVPAAGVPIERWQANRCAMCGCESDRLVMDHDHETGLERGLLCRSCNTNEGMGNDHLAWVRWRAGGHPARLLALPFADHPAFRPEWRL